MKTAGVLSGCLAAFTLAVVVPASAFASFGAPLAIAPPNQAAADTGVATNAAGDTAFVWRRGSTSPHRVMTRTLTAAGVASPVVAVSPPGQNAVSSAVAIDADGDVVFAWEGMDGSQLLAQARTLSSAGVLGPVMDLGPPGMRSFALELAMNASGDAVFTWELDLPGTEPDRMQARRLSPTGVLGPILAMTPPRSDVGSPDVGVDEAGDAVFVWNVGSRPARGQTRSLSAAGVLSPIKTLSPAGEDSGNPEFAVDADGDTVFTWPRVPSPSDRFIVRVRARSAAGALSPIQNLATVPITGLLFWGPHVAIDADGDAVVTWYGFDGTNWRFQARARSASGALSPSQYVSVAGQDASQDPPPRVGMTPGGSAVFAWELNASPSNVIQARVRDPDGSLRATQTVTDPGETAAFTDGDLSVAGQNAALAWLDAGAIRGSLGP